MKKTVLGILSGGIVLLAGCNGATGDGNAGRQLPLAKPGTVMATATMPITEDKLNHFTFSVKVIADSNIAAGVYDVDADYGPNFATSTFTMPKGAEAYQPCMRKGAEPYSYIIGFKIPGDNTFYDYFEVWGSSTTIKMQYIKAYTF